MFALEVNIRCFLSEDEERGVFAGSRTRVSELLHTYYCRDVFVATLHT